MINVNDETERVTSDQADDEVQRELLELGALLALALYLADTGRVEVAGSTAEAERRQAGLTVAALASLFATPFTFDPVRRRFVDSAGRIVTTRALSRISDDLSVRMGRDNRIVINAFRGVMPSATAGGQSAAAVELGQRFDGVLARPTVRRAIIEAAKSREGLRNIILQKTGRTTLPVELPRGMVPDDVFAEYMTERIRAIHRAEAIIAQGGRGQITEDFLRRVMDGFPPGAVDPDGYGGLRFHLDRFDRMMTQIQSGQQRLDGTLVQRGRMYGEAGKQTSDAFLRARMMEDGVRLCANRLGVADHCGECPELTQRGWIPIPDMPLIGQRECLVFCKCTVIFQDPGTGEEL